MNRLAALALALVAACALVIGAAGPAAAAGHPRPPRMTDNYVIAPYSPRLDRAFTWAVLHRVNPGPRQRGALVTLGLEVCDNLRYGRPAFLGLDPAPHGRNARRIDGVIRRAAVWYECPWRDGDHDGDE